MPKVARGLPLTRPSDAGSLAPGRFAFAIVSFLVGAAPIVGAAPARRTARRPPAREASAPMAAAEERDEGPVPGSGTRRPDLARPRPITMPGTGVDRASTDPRRPGMTQMDATDPQRREAREQALASLQEEGGAARVARMAAADVGNRSDEAARVLAEHAGISVLRRLARHTDIQVRLGLARALSYAPKGGQHLLGDLFGDHSIKVVRAALQSAARVGTAPVLGKLAAAALRYDRSIRATAISVLAHHGNLPAARNAVIAAATHPSPSVRSDAVAAIGIARAAWASPYLVRMERDPSVVLRRGVARAFGRLPPDPAIFRVLGRMAKDQSPAVRQEAKRSVTELRRVERAARKAPRSGKRR